MGRAIPLTACTSDGILQCDLQLYLVLSSGTMETWKKFVQFLLIWKNVIKTVIITKGIPSCKHNLITCIESMYVLRNSVTQEDVITSILPYLHDQVN